MIVKFNMRAVPRSVRDNETLVEMVEENTENLQNKHWREGLCNHEAGHALFGEKYGCGRAVFEAPLSFTYDKSRGGSFVFDEARVWLNVPRRWRDDAKHMLAGRIVERALTPKSGWADEVSYANDYHYVYAAFKQGRVPKTRWASLIKRLEAEIRKDLRDPAFRRAIERRAKTYQRILERRIRSLTFPALKRAA